MTVFTTNPLKCCIQNHRKNASKWFFMPSFFDAPIWLVQTTTYTLVKHGERWNYPIFKRRLILIPVPFSSSVKTGRSTAITDLLTTTLPKTNSSPLKMDGWNLSFFLGLPIFRGYVSFSEGICVSKTARFLLVPSGQIHLKPDFWMGQFSCGR